MPATVVLDEVHLTFRIPTTVSEVEVRRIRRVLTSKAFTAAVRRVVTELMKRHPELKPIKLEVNR